MATHLQIYIAEDDVDDRNLIEHCLGKENLGSVQFFPDGEALMLHCNENAKTPFLLLLDLKMPKTDGFEVLDWLKGSKQFQCNPVIVLSSSQEPVDVRKAYTLGANAYLEKPRDLPGYRDMVCAIRKFWIDHNKCSQLD